MELDHQIDAAQDGKLKVRIYKKRSKVWDKVLIGDSLNDKDQWRRLCSYTIHNVEISDECHCM